jgi:hypothetical protein
MQGMEIARNGKCKERNCKEWKLQGLESARKEFARNGKCKEGNCKERKLQGIRNGKCG